MGGEVDKASGRIKEAAGDLTDDDELKAKGKTQRAAGDVKDAGSKLGDKVEDAADNVGDRVKR
ncbi:MAG TPA: CsbD family protein [Candidatus Dormibacteraeota bacterium]|nr:CsbD family protein [Candidatus Dormibacteraeota bacterium]